MAVAEETLAMCANCILSFPYFKLIESKRAPRVFPEPDEKGHRCGRLCPTCEIDFRKNEWAP